MHVLSVPVLIRTRKPFWRAKNAQKDSNLYGKMGENSKNTQESQEHADLIRTRKREEHAGTLRTRMES